jgi:hypothetical protein
MAITVSRSETALAVAPPKSPLGRVERAAERLRRTEQAEKQAREELTAAILEARRAGESLSAIGRAAGISRQWVSRLTGETRR